MKLVLLLLHLMLVLAFAFTSAKFKLILWPLTGNQWQVASGKWQLVDRNPKAIGNAICLRHLHPLLPLLFVLVVLGPWCSLCCGTICPGHATWFLKCLRLTVHWFSLSLSLSLSFNAIYYLKLNIHRTCKTLFTGRTFWLLHLMPSSWWRGEVERKCSSDRT